MRTLFFGEAVIYFIKKKGALFRMKDGTDERILKAAAELYSERGVFGASLGDLAKQVGISKGTLYYYYPTKEALTAAVSERCLSGISDRLFNWVESVPEGSAEDALGALCDSLLGEDMPLRLFTALNNAAEPEGELEESIDRAMNEWNVMIEVGSMRMRADIAAKMKRLTAAILPFFCGLAALNADGEYAKAAFTALIMG